MFLLMEMNLLGRALVGLGDLLEATATYQRALTLCRDSGQIHHAMESLAGLAEVALAQGDLGDSIHRRIPIADELKTRFPATIELAMVSMFLAVIVGVPAGIISAARRNSALDFGTMIGSLIGVSMPIFWLGLMEIMLFAVILGSVLASLVS